MITSAVLVAWLMQAVLAGAAAAVTEPPDTTGGSGLGATASTSMIEYDADEYGPYEPILSILAQHQILPVGGRIPNARIVIVKSRYMLILHCGTRLLKTYKIQLGGEPQGTKTEMGDGRTPEGTYRVCGRNPQSTYYRSLQIDYPGEADIRRALEAGRITAYQARELRDTIAGGGCPSGSTSLGGSIFIHGQHPKRTQWTREENASKSLPPGLERGDVDPAKQDSAVNWTLGCVGMSNADIRELYRFVPDGTVVEILP
jgi:lipoprotein-anchoring transpeptidase ErfK/SrfK